MPPILVDRDFYTVKTADFLVNGLSWQLGNLAGYSRRTLLNNDVGYCKTYIYSYRFADIWRVVEQDHETIELWPMSTPFRLAPLLAVLLYGRTHPIQRSRRPVRIYGLWCAICMVHQPLLYSDQSRALPGDGYLYTIRGHHVPHGKGQAYGRVQ